MLYDNAQLLQIYARGFELTGDQAPRHVAEGIVDWLDREMTDPGGGFFSGIDADSEGEEGRFYVWTTQQVRRVLGDDAALFIDAYGLRDQGNWVEEATGRETGTNICHLTRPIEQLAREHGMTPQRMHARLCALGRQLLAERDNRPRPQTDDKVITAWNAMTIEALAAASTALDRPDYLQRAIRAAEFVSEHMWHDGQLLRSYRHGSAHQPAYLDDYAQWINALIGLSDATGQRQWLDRATEAADRMIALFADDQAGGFFLTSNDHDVWLGRSKNPTGGGNTPSGNGAAAVALTGLARRLERHDYRELARRTLMAFLDPLQRYPQGVLTLVQAAAAYLDLEPGQGTETSTEPVPDSQAGQPPVVVELFASHGKVKPDQPMQLAVRLKLGEGWHVYAPAQTETTVKPLSVELTGPSEPAGSTIHFPPADSHQTDPQTGDPIPTYAGPTVDVLIDLAIPAGAASGWISGTVKVGYQACDESRCAAPHTHDLPWQVRIDPDDPGPGRHGELFEVLNERLR
jgi:hypothetical protein